MVPPDVRTLAGHFVRCNDWQHALVSPDVVAKKIGFDAEVSGTSIVIMAARFRAGAKSEILQDAVGALAAARDHSVTLLPSEHDSWEKRWLALSMCQALTNAQSTVV